MPAAHSLLLNFEELLIKEFKDYLEKKGVSRVTLKNYISDIRNFLSRVALLDTVEGVSGGLNKYLVESSRTYSPATLKRKLSSIRIFCAWAVEKGHFKENPLVQGVIKPEDQKTQSLGKSETQYIGESVDQKSDIPKLRHSDPLSPLTPRPSNTRVSMPSELTTPYKVKGAESLFLHRAKTTAAAVSGFGSVFLFIFIVKILFGDSLLAMLGVGGNESQKNETTFQAPQERPTLSFRDLLEQPVVLGITTQETLRQGTEVLPAGSTEVSVYNPSITSSSIIQVIPENSIESALSVDQKASGNYFTVEVDHPIPYDVAFNWQIIELQ